MESFLHSIDQDLEIEDLFKRFVKHFDNDRTFAEGLWAELEKAYTQKGRHYHTLNHLTHMLEETVSVLSEIEAPDTLCCSIFYHDIIYNVKRQDNEERSADIGIQRALDIGLGVKGARLCKDQIIATKSHTLSDNMDTNYLTDIDLSVLGAAPEVYQNYTAVIRKEYAIYPGFLYRRGRKKVLKHFLEMDRIFKTGFFRDSYEIEARAILKSELDSL